MNEEPKREFVTSTGKVIRLQPVASRLFTDAEAAVEREFLEAEKPIEPPKYEVPTTGGGSKSFYFDEETIKSRTEKGTLTDEEKEAWAAHLECLVELKAAQDERGTVVAIIEGVLEEPTDEWRERMEYYKVELPENPFDLKVRYVLREFLRTPMDTALFSAALMLLSAGMEVDQVAIDAAMESFRDSIRGRVRPILDKLAEAIAKRGAKLDLQSDVPEGEGGGEPGQVDDGVRPDEQE